MEFIQGQRFDKDEILVFFDVKSLLTNVPVHLAIKVASERFQNDDTLEVRIFTEYQRRSKESSRCTTSRSV